MPPTFLIMWTKVWGKEFVEFGGWLNEKRHRINERWKELLPKDYEPELLPLVPEAAPYDLDCTPDL